MLHCRNVRFPPWLPVACCLLLSASLLPPVGAPPTVKQCPLKAILEKTGEPTDVVACLEIRECDEDVENWRFENYSTSSFAAVAAVPARSPERIGVDLLDAVDGDVMVTDMVFHWSLPAMSFDVQGFAVIAKSYINGSISTICRMITIDTNTTDTYSNVEFKFTMGMLTPDAGYNLAVFSAPLSPIMPTESGKEWLVLQTRSNYKSNEPVILNWRPNLVVQRMATPGEMKVQFSVVPEFRVFEIAILNVETKDLRTLTHEVDSLNATSTFVVIPRIFKGTYQVMVRPYNNPNMCVCYEDNMKNGTCMDHCPETFTMRFEITDDEPPAQTAPLVVTETAPRLTIALQTTIPNIPDEVLTPEATRIPEDDFVVTTTTNDPLNMMPSTIQRTNNSLIGGLIGGLVAAGLFSFIVVVFAVLDKPPPPRKSKVSTN